MATKRTQTGRTAAKSARGQSATTGQGAGQSAPVGPASVKQGRHGGKQPPGDVGQLVVHFLDVGQEQYGDAVLCLFGDTTVLIDGAHPGNFKDEGDTHPSIPSQVASLLAQKPGALHVSLLICTHCHLDHIGCLPKMVENGLTADWVLLIDPRLGWGKTPTDAVGMPGVSADVARVAAALREEPLAATTDATTVQRFMSDAAGLEATYTTMVETLEQNGSRVVRYGRDDAIPVLQALLAEFAHVGLSILGPTQDHVLYCAEMITGRSKALTDMASDALRATDAVGTGDADAREVSAYRRAVRPAMDAFDAAGRDKGAINDQSLVTRFEYRGEKLLFTGDMQLSDPQVSDQRVVDSMLALRAAIKADGPYALVKLAHHGSDNGFSEAVLTEFGALMVGICAGEGSKSHPNPATLKTLQAHTQDMEWVRTDRNGSSTFSLNARGQAELEVTRGHTNDARPNSVDVVTVNPAPAAGTPLPVAPAPATLTPTASGVAAAEGGLVSLITQLLERADRVSVTISAERGSGGSGAGRTNLPATPSIPSEGSERPFRGAGSDFRLAGGRSLPALAFVTNQQRLAANIGVLEAGQVIGALQNSGHEIIEVPLGADPLIGVQVVRDALRARTAAGRATVRGVVLLGGYDVVLPRRLDCLPPRLRARLDSRVQDPDDFIVWNDDIWADLDGDELPELPVSRIPDGKSAALVMAALGAGMASRCPIPKAGIRNVARPFADDVFNGLAGAGPFLQSEPAAHDQSPAYDLCADRLYLMLHGSDQDGTRYWGETANGYLEAVGTRNLSSWRGDVVFTGCCWGALPVDTLAVRAQPGRPLGARVAGASLALQFLQAGATAFVGCTGAHYSPTDVSQQYNYFGGPMHRAFWAAESGGQAPAEALLTAKRTYMRDMPHGQSEASAQAIEFKILWEYTCLGLGW